MNRPSGAFKQTERSCESKMEGSHPDKLTVSTEKLLSDLSSEKFKSFSKKCLTTHHESDKISKLSAAKAAAHRTLKIEQYRKNL